jgi:hypothetical protein
MRTEKRGSGKAHGRRIGSLNSLDDESPASRRHNSHFTPSSDFEDNPQVLVNHAASHGMSPTHLQQSHELLLPLGVDSFKLSAMITEHNRLHRTSVFPLLDHEKQQGLRDVASLLYQLGLSPREVGKSLLLLPEVAEMSTAALGLRVLRCKALGMNGGHIAHLISTAPVVLLWEDECAHPHATSILKSASITEACVKILNLAPLFHVEQVMAR